MHRNASSNKNASSNGNVGSNVEERCFSAA